MEQYVRLLLADPLGSRELMLALAGAVVLLILLLALTIWISARARKRDAVAAERQGELADGLAALMQAQAELTGRMRGMGEYLGARHSDLARVVAERLDAVGDRVGRGLE